MKIKSNVDFGGKANLKTVGNFPGRTLGDLGLSFSDLWKEYVAAPVEQAVQTTAQEILPEDIYLKAEEYVEGEKVQQYVTQLKEGGISAVTKTAQEIAAEQAAKIVGSKEAQDSAIKAGVEKVSQELILMKDALRAGTFRQQYPGVFWSAIGLGSILTLAIAFRVGKFVTGKK